MEWIKCSDRLPTEEMDLVCIIGGVKFLGFSRFYRNVKICDPNYILYQIPITFGFSDLIMNSEGGWSKPQHFAEVTHWMPLPKPPKE